MQNKPVINSPKLKILRKLHRNNPAPRKLKLGSHLKGWQSDGYKFSRQTSINDYIVNFVCCGLKLIIELDGSGHLQEYQKKKDKTRRQDLEFWDFKIIRSFNLGYSPQSHRATRSFDIMRVTESFSGTIMKKYFMLVSSSLTISVFIRVYLRSRLAGELIRLNTQ